MESVYQRAMLVELHLREIRFQTQVPVVDYQGWCVGAAKLDVLVGSRMLSERHYQALMILHIFVHVSTTDAA